MALRGAPRKISPFAAFAVRGMTLRMRTRTGPEQRRWLVLAGIAALLAGCDACEKSTEPDAGPEDAGPPILTEKEPDDGPQQAIVIERSSIVEANLGADPA